MSSSSLSLSLSELAHVASECLPIDFVPMQECFRCNKLLKQTTGKKYYWYDENGMKNSERRICYHCSVPVFASCPCTGIKLCEKHKTGRIQFLEEKREVILDSKKKITEKLKEQNAIWYDKVVKMAHAPSQKTRKDQKLLRQNWLLIRMDVELERIEQELKNIQEGKQEMTKVPTIIVNNSQRGLLTELFSEQSKDTTLILPEEEKNQILKDIQEKFSIEPGNRKRKRCFFIG
jgi:glutaredoxin